MNTPNSFSNLALETNQSIDSKIFSINKFGFILLLNEYQVAWNRSNQKLKYSDMNTLSS